VVDIKNCKRITIIGNTGSGKSWLARKLGKILDLPVTHCDCIFLKENWVPENKEVVATKLNEIALQDKWIIDGNYKRSMENRFERADAIIFLNYPENFCIESIMNRKNERRIGIPNYLNGENDNVEALIMHVKEFKEKLEKIQPLLEKHKDKVIEFVHRGQVNHLISSLCPAQIHLIKESEIAECCEMIEKTIKYSFPKFYSQKVIDEFVLPEICNKDNLKQKMVDGHFYVAAKNDKIIGCGAVAKHNNECKFSIIFVNPEFQGAGIGKKIIETLQNDDITKQSKRIEIPSSLSAVSFYKKMGFEHKGGYTTFKDGCIILEKFVKDKSQ
jgi:adenylate kinase family enzyme/N-acetylglutamate synthase-like GNAT family acetyltransferase